MGDERIFFDYVLRTTQGADVALAMDSIATRLHSELSAEFLDCKFEELGKDFYTHSLTSLPADLVRPEACTAEQAQDDAGDCIVVAAAFVALVFFQENNNRIRHRNLEQMVDDASSTSSSVVAEAYAAAIENIFRSGTLLAGFSDILGAEYVDTVAPPAEKEAEAVEKSPGAKAGISIGVLLGVFLLVAITWCCCFGEHDNEESSKDLNDTADSAIFREEDVFTLSQPANGNAMIANKSIRSDDVSYLATTLSQYHQQMADSRKVSVVHADQSQDDYLEPGDDLERSFEIEAIPPSFQRVESQSLQAGHYPQRAYGVPDTVEL